MVLPVQSVSEMTLDDAFPDRLTNTPCAYINMDSEVWVATEMCVQYLESVIDSIMVRDHEKKPVGMVGGYDLLDCVRKNPTREFQYEHRVKDIMFKDFLVVSRHTRLKELIEKWRDTRRAFAVIENELGGHSPVSARKMLELGIRCKTDISISSLPKKKVLTFQPDEPLSNIIETMFENKTRKLILEYSNQFISDRLILEEISNILKFRPDIENLLDIPVNQIELQNTKVVKTDLDLGQLCSIMYEMDHPYVVYKDITVSPWDVCVALLSEDIGGIVEVPSSAQRIVCPHCGNDFVLN